MILAVHEKTLTNSHLVIQQRRLLVNFKENTPFYVNLCGYDGEN